MSGEMEFRSFQRRLQIKAIKTAKKAIEQRRRQIAYDANMAKMYGADYPQAVAALEEREDLDQASAVLDELVSELAGLNGEHKSSIYLKEVE
jgi:hypothetical protein